MGNVAPKVTNRIDDDADFGASFVLGRAEVDEALAAPCETLETHPPGTARARRKLIYLGGAIATAILIGVASLRGGR